jgi:hypothetical protein
MAVAAMVHRDYKQSQKGERMDSDTNHKSSEPSLSPDPIKVFWTLFALAGTAFCLTVQFMGMRGIMRLGGMVATGGPYAIEHPAPGWVWVMPVSILAGLILVFVYAVMASKAKIPSLIGYAWPALFLSLGWNFFEFGFRPPGGHGWAWGWLVCGVTFALMGGVPLYFLLGRAFHSDTGKPVSDTVIANARIRKIMTGSPTGQEAQAGSGRLLFLALEIAAVLGGMYGAVQFFRAVS